jgi:integrase
VAVRKRERNRDLRAAGLGPEPVIVVRTQVTVGEFAREWVKERDRTRQSDAQRLRDHVLPLLGGRRLRDIRSEDLAEVIRHTLAKKGMKVESARKAYAVLSDLLGAALERKLMHDDPRSLPADIWPQEDPSERPRFSPEEVAALTTDERLDAEHRLMHRLAFSTGLPSPVLAMLRFGDWSERLEAPAPPELAAAIEQWKAQGFEAVFGRAPGDSDWLVPRRSNPSDPYTEGALFKTFRRACVALGIKTRSPQAVRNTFEALAGTGPKAADAVETRGGESEGS